MWREERHGLGYREGFYIFGGMNERSVVLNDLWIAVPDYEYNKDMLCIVDCEFVGFQSLGLSIKKIDDFSGKPPCPRS